MNRYIRAYIRAKRSPGDAYFAWSLWDAGQALKGSFEWLGFTAEEFEAWANGMLAGHPLGKVKVG